MAWSWPKCLRPWLQAPHPLKQDLGLDLQVLPITHDQSLLGLRLA